MNCSLTSENFEKLSIAETSALYDRRGNDYLKGSENSYGSQRAPIFISEPYIQAEKLIAKALVPGANQQLLDLCCGTGLHSIYPAKIGFQVKGIDISPKSIEAAIRLADRSRSGIIEKCGNNWLTPGRDSGRGDDFGRKRHRVEPLD